MLVSLNDQEITQDEFFDILVATAAQGGIDTSGIDVDRIDTLRGSSLVPRWIESLPYRSRILNLTEEEFGRLTGQQRDDIKTRMKNLTVAYGQILEGDDWIPLVDGADEQDFVIPLRLDLLP